MIARIKLKNTEIYTSAVLAISYRGWSTKAVIFDDKYENILAVDYWLHGRSIFLVENGRDNWIKKGKWEGFDWLLNDKKIMRRLTGLFSKRKVPITSSEYSKPYAHDFPVPEWITVKNQEDIDCLSEVSFGFHDSLISEPKYIGNILEIKADTTWGCEIVLRFCDVTEFDLNDLYSIMSSEINQVDGQYVWSIDGDTSAGEGMSAFVKAGGICWHLKVYD